jgi:release factor glutamine methyltransferase
MSSPILQPNLSTLHSTIRFLPFMDIVKRRILQDVQELLIHRFNAGEVPGKGVLLYFTENMDFAYIFSFDFANRLSGVQVIDRVLRPRALFDLGTLRELRSQRAKNAAKLFLTSGHKIIVQGGVLTHVDRSVDRDVFGPTIDTLLLAEEAAAFRMRAPERVLEIGSGNGHIISSIAATMPTVQNAVFIDIEPHAIACTLRNLRANLVAHRMPHMRELKYCYGVAGRFSRVLKFGQRFDLVISNPPYIALAPDVPAGDARLASAAVTGTALLEEIVASAGKLLTPNGRMLVMVSSTSGDVVNRALPQGFRTEQASHVPRMQVPFDVEDVLDHPSWIAWLEKSKAIRKRTGEYFHDLIPTWIVRRPK